MDGAEHRTHKVERDIALRIERPRAILVVGSQ